MARQATEGHLWPGSSQYIWRMRAMSLGFRSSWCIWSCSIEWTLTMFNSLCHWLDLDCLLDSPRCATSSSNGIYCKAETIQHQTLDMTRSLFPKLDHIEYHLKYTPTFSPWSTMYIMESRDIPNANTINNSDSTSCLMIIHLSIPAVSHNNTCVNLN